MTATHPPHLGAWHQLAIGTGDHATKAILDVLAQGVVRGQLGNLGATGTPLRVPLRSRCPISHTWTTNSSVTPHLPRNRRRTTTQTATDLTHPNTLRITNGDLFPLGKRQIAARHRTQTDRRHPTSLPEPSRPNRRRHPNLTSRILARNTIRDRLPEPDPILTPRFRQATTSGHAPHESPADASQHSSQTSFITKCCDDHLNPPRAPPW